MKYVLSSAAILAACAGLARAQTGACCIGAVGDCTDITGAACAAAGGVYRGDGTACATTVCLRYVRPVNGSGSAAGIGQFIDFTPDAAASITALDYYVTSTSGAGAPLILDVWVHDGTYREAETFDPAKWTLHETLNGVSVGGGSTTPVRVNLANPILCQAGRTKGLFLHTRQGTMHFRANTERNPSIYSNGEATLYSERYRFGTGGGGWNGTLTTARDFMGAIYYVPESGGMTSTCCRPDGTCQDVASLAACQVIGGLFMPGTSCQTITCPSKAACCYRDGSCAEVWQDECTGRFQGVWQGPGSTCGGAACAQPGACCFAPDATGAGGCVQLSQAECLAAGGTFQGINAGCKSGGCWTAPVLWNNGPIATSLNASDLQPGNVLFGGNAYRVVSGQPSGFTLSDDFSVIAAGGWQVEEVTLFAHRNNASTTNPTFFSKACLEIWDAPPGTPGATVVFGDSITNRLLSAVNTGVYRNAPATPNLNRPVFALTLAVSTHLPQGQYWLRYSLEANGNEAFECKTPFVTLVGARAPVEADASQTLGNTYFYPLLDDVNLPLVPQQLPFIVKGQALAGTCYANCDQSAAVPVLNVADFTCFLTKFAGGDPYANCDGSTAPPTLNVADFTCFLTKYAAGCP